MALRYYDDAIVAKLKKWIPSNAKLRVLKPDETSRFFALNAEDTNDRPADLPLIMLSRGKDFELLLNIKSPKSFDGLRITSDDRNNKTALLNAIPIKVEYQVDIVTKTEEENDEYLRNFLFKLINNPTIYIDIPYNGMNLKHIANLRVLSTVSDTSDISEILFVGQFTRYTIHIELQDGFLFNIPYKQNWTIKDSELQVLAPNTGDVESVEDIDIEILDDKIQDSKTKLT